EGVVDQPGEPAVDRRGPRRAQRPSDQRVVGGELGAGGGDRHGQRASRPCSPVRIRTTWSRSATHTFPSPILPVRAASTTASTRRSPSLSSASTSMRALGTKSILYSAPR